MKDVVSGKVKKVNLGQRDGRSLSISHTIIEQHIAKKHLGENEKHPRNVPLTKEDFELVPTLWREGTEKPANSERRKAYEMETVDGHTLRMIVDDFRGITTIFKMKGSPGAS